MKRLLILIGLFLAVGSYGQTLAGPVTGIEDDYQLSELKVYPNPVANQVTVELDAEEQAYEASVFTTSGVLVRQVTLTRNSSNLDLSTVPRGIYVLAVYSTDQKKANLFRLSKL